MKRILPFLFIFLMLPGCGTFTSLKQHVFGKASQKAQAISTRIDVLEDAQAANSEKRLTHIGAWAEGTSHALQKSTNQEPAVFIAKETNERVIALAGKPEYAELQEVYKLVDTFLTNQAAGNKMLAQKDKIIIDLNKSVKEVEQAKQAEIEKSLKLAQSTAAHADALKATLQEYQGWFGLKAVGKGLLQFVKSSMWVLGIGSILFLILRLLASTNPIASAVFGIFDQIGSWFVHVIQLVVPKAVALAGNVSKSLFDSYKGTMVKIVDAIQMAKTTAGAAGKEPTLQDVINEVEKTMSPDEKAIVDGIKAQLNWK